MPDFFAVLKELTEARWATHSIDPTLYGFQFQPGTRWNPGLSKNEIGEYEAATSARFPADFKAFLSAMNGTDLPTMNVYGGSGTPPQYSAGVYAYPRDLEVILRMIADIDGNRGEITNQLQEQGYALPETARLLPIFSNRYIVCESNPETSAVLSIVTNATDAIVYGSSLTEYLRKEFLDCSL